MSTLENKIAVVAGATRGAGRGIARALAEAGAIVYCTGRSRRNATSTPGRPESIDETADLIAGAGGRAIAVGVDHTDDAAVRSLFDRVAAEQGGVDILVNNVNGDALTDWMHSFWDSKLADGLAMLERGVFTHVRTAHAAIPKMLGRGGMIAGITDVGSASLFYGLTKRSVSQLAELLAPELRPHGIASMAVAPGFLRSEAMLDRFGVTEATWRDAIAKDKYFAGSETPAYVGRAIVALAGDPSVLERTGKTLTSWQLADDYGFTDADGTRPHWDRFLQPFIDEKWAHMIAETAKQLTPDDRFEPDRAALALRASPGGKRVERVVPWPELLHAITHQIAAEFATAVSRKRG
jgi:NAD(P)-dependent dehydrogenase (short-subunit alcohol dehydrogenase family)